MKHRLAAVGRVARILSVSARHLAWMLMEVVTQRLPKLTHKRRGAPISGPERLRRVLEDLGGSFIKFGQMLALQPDVLTLEYCNALFDLMDRVPPFDFTAVERTFVEEFGRPPDELFDRFERRPLASASIGQVHVAFANGAKYAVKVQRPDAAVSFTADIALMTLFGAVIRGFGLRRFYWMLEPIGEFTTWTLDELDYRTEERYLVQLRANAEGSPFERVPACLSHVTSRRTLATEFLDGATVLSHLRAASTDKMARPATPHGFVPAVFAQHIIDNFLSDVFRHGLFHADLHPANLMILPNNVVGYIDFGITGAISGHSRENLVGLTLAYTRGDVDSMADAFFKLCVVGASDGPQRFRVGLRSMAREWYDRRNGTVRLRKNFTLVMLDMLRLSHRTSVWPERDVIKYIRSAIAIDGLITRFAPSFNVGAYLERVCAQHLRWHARMKLLQVERAFEWIATTARLVQHAPARADAMFDRLQARDRGTRFEARSGAGGLRRKALALAGATLAFAAAARINDATAAIAALQLVMAGIAAARLCITIRRLA
jgi:ubiquinone biosynthesis protein